MVLAVFRILNTCVLVFCVVCVWSGQSDFMALFMVFLTLSDPTSDLVQHYDFPVPLRCGVTSDTFLLRLFTRSAVGACPTLFFAFVRPLCCRSLSDTFPHVVRTLANK